MKREFIIVGKIGTSYGVHGWLKIQTYTEFGASILEYKPWYLSRDKEEWSPIDITDGKVQSNVVLAKLESVDTPEAAKLLTGNFIAITRQQLPKLPKNEFYWTDLEGLTVINKEGTILGQVSYLMESGAHDVLVVKGEKEQAIPFLMNKVILKVDLEKGEIHVDWEGI